MPWEPGKGHIKPACSNVGNTRKYVWKSTKSRKSAAKFLDFDSFEQVDTIMLLERDVLFNHVNSGKIKPHLVISTR